MEVSWMLIIVLCSFKFGVFAFGETDDNETAVDDVCKQIKAIESATSGTNKESDIICSRTLSTDGASESDNAEMMNPITSDSSESTTLVDTETTDLVRETSCGLAICATETTNETQSIEYSTNLTQSTGCRSTCSENSEIRAQSKNNETVQKFVDVSSTHEDSENAVMTSESETGFTDKTQFVTPSYDRENITAIDEHSAHRKVLCGPSKGKEPQQTKSCRVCSDSKNRGSKSTTTANICSVCGSKNEVILSGDSQEDDSDESEYPDDFPRSEYADGDDFTHSESTNDDFTRSDYTDSDDSVTSECTDTDYTADLLDGSNDSTDESSNELEDDQSSNSPSCNCWDEATTESPDVEDYSSDVPNKCEGKSNRYSPKTIKRPICSRTKYPSDEENNCVGKTSYSRCSRRKSTTQYPDDEFKSGYECSGRNSKYSDEDDTPSQYSKKKCNKCSKIENDASDESRPKYRRKKPKKCDDAEESLSYAIQDLSDKSCQKCYIRKHISKKFPSDINSYEKSLKARYSKLEDFEENEIPINVIPRSVKKITVDPLNIKMSRKRTKVVKPIGKLLSHAGFFKTNEEDDTHLFFWFFRSEKNWRKAPVIVWLQGEPGWSSMYSLFEEHGPYYIKNTTQGLTIKLREFAWTKVYNVLYLDHCIGCGFSLASEEEAYVPNYENVGQNVYEALYQFFRVFPEYKRNDLYLGGSYGGAKYVPVIADVIHSKNRFSGVQMNLKGMLIGGPYVDAAAMVKYSDFLLKANLIDNKTVARLNPQEAYGRELIYAGKYQNAINYLEKRIYKTLKSIGYEKLYDIRYKKPNNDVYMFEQYVPEIVKTKQFRQMICLNQVAFQHRSKVLIEEIMHPVDHLLPELLSHYKILYYLGRWDLMAPFTESFRYIETIKWEGIDNFFQRKAQSWCAPKRNGEELTKNCVDGYYKNYQNLTTVLLFDAGHTCGSTSAEHLFYVLQAFMDGKFEQKESNANFSIF